MKKITIICALFAISIKHANSGCLNFFSGCISTCKTAKDTFCGGGDKVVVNVTTNNNANNPNTYKEKLSNRSTPEISLDSIPRKTPHQKTPLDVLDDQDNDLNTSDPFPLPLPPRERSETLTPLSLSSQYYFIPVSVSPNPKIDRKSHEYEMITMTKDDNIRHSTEYNNPYSTYNEYKLGEAYYLHEQNIESRIKETISKNLKSYKEKFTADMSSDDFIKLCNTKIKKFKNKAEEYDPKDIKHKKYLRKEQKYQEILDHSNNIQLLFEKFSDNSIIFKENRKLNHKRIQLISERNMQKYIKLGLEKSYDDYHTIIGNLEDMHVLFGSEPPEDLQELAETQTSQEFKKSLKKFINLQNSYVCSPITNKV